MTEGSEGTTARPTSYSRVSLGIMAHASEANLLGNVHGGEIMKLADSTAGAVAHRHSGGPAVTAAMDEMTFLAPVHVGDVPPVRQQAGLGRRLGRLPRGREPGRIPHDVGQLFLRRVHNAVSPGPGWCPAEC